MLNSHNLYKLIRLELQDAKADLNYYCEKEKIRYSEKQIEGEVYQQNIAFYHKEIDGIDLLIKSLEEAKQTIPDETKEFFNELAKFFEKKIRSSGYPRGLFMLARRKLHKLEESLAHY